LKLTKYKEAAAFYVSCRKTFHGLMGNLKLREFTANKNKKAALLRRLYLTLYSN